MKSSLDHAITETILLRLKLLAKEMGMTETARRCGLKREYLYQVFLDGHNPSIQTVAKIAEGLGFRLELRPIAKGVKG